MKLNKYFMFALAGLAFAACSDDLDGNAQQGENQNQEGTTYAAISLKFGNGTTARAVGDLPTGTEKAAEGNEADVNTVRLIITDATTNKVEYNKKYTKSAAEEADQTKNKYVFSIQPGQKKFYAFVNEEADNTLDTEAAVNATWDGTTKTIAKKASELGTYAAMGEGVPFVMSSTEVETWDILANVDQATAEAGTKNKVDLTVERMVAKVTVQLASTLVADDGFADQPVTLTALTAQIGNADNVTYAKDDATTKYKSPAESYRIAFNENGVRKTPSYYTYANKTTDFYTDFSRANLLSGNEETLYAPNAEGDAVKNPVARFYCLENTHASADYLQSNTTFVSVKATMTANKVVKITYAKAQGSEGQEDYQAERIEPSTNNANSATGTFYLIENAPDHSLVGGYMLETDLAGLYGAEDGDIINGQATTNTEKATAVIEELNKRGYSFSEPYTNGVGYFNVWVNDMKDQTTGAYLGIAPVFRNDWYGLTIQSIKLPGNPTPDLDPEKPLHPDTYIGVTVTVKWWNSVTYDIDLQ